MPATKLGAAEYLLGGGNGGIAMGMPSVVKIKKGNVEYTGKVDIAKYTLKELTHRAMIDVGRYVLYNVRKNLHAIFPYTVYHFAEKRYQMWVRKKEIDLILGIDHLKKGSKSAWWSDQLETDRFTYTPPRKKTKKKNKEPGKEIRKVLGSSLLPRRHILETFVKGHVDKIVEIESKYLSYMNEEDAAMAAIAETAEKEIQE